MNTTRYEYLTQTATTHKPPLHANRLYTQINQGDNGASGFEVTPGITSALPTLSGIIKVGVEDKIQQVFFSTIALMDAVLVATRRAKMPRSVVAPLFDPVVAILIEKLADGNARIREGITTHFTT